MKTPPRPPQNWILQPGSEVTDHALKIIPYDIPNQARVRIVSGYVAGRHASEDMINGNGANWSGGINEAGVFYINVNDNDFIWSEIRVKRNASGLWVQDDAYGNSIVAGQAIALPSATKAILVIGRVGVTAYFSSVKEQTAEGSYTWLRSGDPGLTMDAYFLGQ